MLKIGLLEKLILDEGDRFLVGVLENDGAVGGNGTLGLLWQKRIGGCAPSCVICPIEEMNPPNLTASYEVTAHKIKVNVSDAGAESYLLADETGDLLEMNGRSGEIELTAGKYVYAVTVYAENSRGNRLHVLLNVTVSSEETNFVLVKDLFPLVVFPVSERVSFAARITAAESGRPLCRGEIDSITCAVRRLIRNEIGKGSVPADSPYGKGVPVPLTSLSDTISLSSRWKRDKIGGNFEFNPNLPIGNLTGGNGIFDVLFKMKLKNGTVLPFGYSVIVWEREKINSYRFFA